MVNSIMMNLLLLVQGEGDQEVVQEAGEGDQGAVQEAEEEGQEVVPEAEEGDREVEVEQEVGVEVEQDHKHQAETVDKVLMMLLRSPLEEDLGQGPEVDQYLGKNAIVVVAEGSNKRKLLCHFIRISL